MTLSTALLILQAAAPVLDGRLDDPVGQIAAPNDGVRGADSGWDPVWETATRVDSLGWVAGEG